MRHLPDPRHPRAAGPPSFARAVLGLLVLSLGALTAGAAEITVVSKMEASRGPSGTQTLYIGEGHVRVKDPSSDVIVDYESGVMTTLEHQKKRYWQTTPEELAATFEELSEMMEGNPVFERMLGGDEAVTVETKGSRTIAGQPCIDHTVEMGSAYRIDVCIASDLETPVDVHEVRKMFFAAMGPMAGKINRLFDELSEIGGVALYTKIDLSMMGMDFSTETTAQEVTVGPLPGDTFDIPAGYKKTKAPFGR